jgi:tRNA(Ile)-lysidine synthase
VGVDLAALRGLEDALRTRLLRLAALRAGVPPRELAYGHVQALEAMVWEKRGEPRDLDLPGHVRASRRDDVIRFVDTRPQADGPVAG